MFMFRCEKCGGQFPLPKVYDGWVFGEPPLCQPCKDKLKDAPTPRK